MSYGLAYGLSRLRPGRAAEDLHRRSQGADGAVLRPVRRGARLPARRRRPGAQGRLHLDGVRQAALPAGAGQQQPQRPRGRRAGRAQRADPGQRRRHHQGGDDQRRQGAQGRRAEVADAAAGARRTAVRGRRRRARRRSRSWCATRWAAPTRWTCRSRSSVGYGRSWDSAAH